MDLTCWDRMFGLPQSGGRGFGGIYHMRHGKSMGGFKTKEAPKPIGFLLKENKFQKYIWDGKNQKKGFQ